MGSLREYCDLFLLVEASAFRSGLELLSQPNWFAHLYVIIVAGFIAWETLFPWRPAQKRLRDSAGLDLFYTVFNYLIFWMLIGTAVCEVTSVVFRDALQHYFGAEHWTAVRLTAFPVWLRYLLLLLALDLTSWCGHWLLHRVDFLWQFHKVHHSALELDVLNAGRIHFVEKLFYPLFFYIPMGMIGFELQDTMVVSLFVAIFSAFTHANVRLPLGPLKYVLNNPQIHLWHHAIEVDRKHNVNYGDALCLWDYLFGTAYLPDDRNELELGFEDITLYPKSFLGQLVAPFRGLLLRDG